MNREELSKVAESSAELRALITAGISEEFFIENFDIISESILFKKFDPFKKGHNLARLLRYDINTILTLIYDYNTISNSWAMPENISNTLKLFLKLQGEEI